VESEIWLYEVAKARDPYALIKYDSSGAVSKQMFMEDWTRFVLKLATGAGKTKDNVAAYTAAAALDDNTLRILRIAGDSVNVQQIAQSMTEVSGAAYRPQWVGGLGVLSLMIRIAKLVAPQPTEPFPPWQGMQYLRDMFSGRGKLHGIDNNRYSNLVWTSVREHLETINR
jgi:hypothetical protein